MGRKARLDGSKLNVGLTAEFLSSNASPLNVNIYRRATREKNSNHRSSAHL
jgi:hypothetical protein